MTLFIPSPSISSFQLGPLTIHIYALCLITGIIVAWTIGLRRWQARGGSSESFETILLWAIPSGILGARFYHVLTHLGDYFAPGINPWSVFYIWEGGIAIYGAVGFGALAAWLVARHRKVAFAALADSLAPAIAVGQAIGRFGNWFNQELYGQPTDLPWALEIDPAHRAPGFEQYETFHPTFLYESIWNLFVAGVLLWCDRKFRLGRGKVFALYIALYGLGRTFTESIRLDYSYDVFGPVRFNAAVAILICLSGIVLFWWLSKYRPGREEQVEFGAGAGARRAAGPLPGAESEADAAPDLAAADDSGDSGPVPARLAVATEVEAAEPSEAEPDPTGSASAQLGQNAPDEAAGPSEELEIEFADSAPDDSASAEPAGSELTKSADLASQGRDGELKDGALGLLGEAAESLSDDEPAEDADEATASAGPAGTSESEAPNSGDETESEALPAADSTEPNSEDRA